MKSKTLNILLNIIIILLLGCEDNSVDPEIFEKINVDIRMEVQILDSTYQIYSRPHTKVYFTTYKVNKENIQIEMEQSDTTSCPNGWGVKLLNYTFDNTDEKIYLGAACEAFDGPNYKEVTIDYDEAKRRIDTLNHASVIKTFAIYYK